MKKGVVFLPFYGVRKFLKVESLGAKSKRLEKSETELRTEVEFREDSQCLRQQNRWTKRMM